MNELKEIERLTLENNGYESFDTWSEEPRPTLYAFLVKEFGRSGISCFVGECGSYFVYHRNGRAGLGGMDEGRPDAMNVEKAKYKVSEEKKGRRKMDIINVDESPSLAEMQKAERRLRDELREAISNFELKTKTRVKGGLRIKRERDTGLVSDVLVVLDILA